MKPEMDHSERHWNQRWLVTGLAVFLSLMPTVSDASATPPTLIILKGGKSEPAHQPVRLSVGETAVVTVPAAEPYCDSRLLVSAGESYQIEPLPGLKWQDWWISSGPEGYSRWYLDWYMNLPLFSQAKPLPKERYFVLCGAVHTSSGQKKASQIFPIKKTGLYPISHGGHLVFFANDTRVAGNFFYRNNRGCLVLLVSKRAPEVSRTHNG